MVSFFYSLAGNQLFGCRIVMSDFFTLAAVIEEVTDGFSGFVYSRTLYDGNTSLSEEMIPAWMAAFRTMAFSNSCEG